MVIELFIREFSHSKLFSKRGWRLFTSLLSTGIFIALFIYLEVYLYSRLYDQLDIYTGFNSSFLTILIFAFLMIGVIFLVPTIYSVFFKNADEKVILGSRPVRIAEIFTGKALYCYVKGLFFSFATLLPLMIVYGIRVGGGVYFYLGTVFSILILSFFVLGLALLIAIPFREVFYRLKRHTLILLLITLIIVFGLTFLYADVLDVFVSLVRSSSLDSLFTTSRIATMTSVAQNLYPAICMTDLASMKYSLYQVLIEVAFASGSLAISVPLFILYFKHYLKNNSDNTKHKVYFGRAVSLSSPTVALIKKELTIVFNDSDGVFSYFSLICVQPLLVYAVISAIDLIFTTGNLNYMRTMYPTFTLCLNAGLILLFLAVINSTSSLSLSKEKETITLLKTFPVSPAKQLLIKLLVPYSLSALSYIITMIVIGCLLTSPSDSFSASSVPFSWTGVILMMIIGLVALLILNLTSLYSDLKMKNHENVFSVVMDFILPLLFVVISGLLTLLVPDDHQELSFYLILLGLELIAAVPLVVKFRSRAEKLFLKYEGGASS